MKVFELCNILEEIAPLKRQEEWDNCGLLIGEFGNEVDKILVCLDIDLEILEYAKKHGYNFIISHHPLIFKGVKRIVEEDMVQKIIAIAIKEKISIYSMHTNYDFADYAMNDYIAELLSLKDVKGYIKDEKRGFMVGRLGQINTPLSIKEFAKIVKDKLKLNKITYTGTDDLTVQSVLISTGAFDMELLRPSAALVDVIVSGDIKYHMAKDLLVDGILVIDAGHFGTEITFPKLIQKQLSNILNDVMIDVADFEKDIFKHISE